MEYFYTKRLLDLSGINPDLGLPSSMFPRYPPGISPPSLGLMNQNRLKKKFFHDNASINTKLNDFHQRYQKFASGLFEVAYPSFPPGHPLFSRFESTTALQSENDKLRKENLELKKQIEKNQKTKSKF